MDRRRYSFGASAPKEPLRRQQGLSPPSFCLSMRTLGEAVPVVVGGYLRTAGWRRDHGRRRAGGRREPESNRARLAIGIRLRNRVGQQAALGRITGRFF